MGRLVAVTRRKSTVGRDANLYDLSVFSTIFNMNYATTLVANKTTLLGQQQQVLFHSQGSISSRGRRAAAAM